MSLAAVGADIAGNVLGAGVQGWFGRESAKDQMAFQERMSNTAYQRAAKDLEAAGLNRIIAFGSPASSPSGASSSINVPALGSSGTNAANAASARALQEANTRVLIAQEEKAKAETENVRQDTQLKMLDAVNRPMQGTLWDAQAKNLLSGIPVNEAQARNLQEQLQKIAAEVRLTNANASQAEFQKILYDKALPIIKPLLDQFMPGPKAGAGFLDSARSGLTDMLWDFSKLFYPERRDTAPSYRSSFPYKK